MHMQTEGLFNSVICSDGKSLEKSLIVNYIYRH